MVASSGTHTHSSEPLGGPEEGAPSSNLQDLAAVGTLVDDTSAADQQSGTSQISYDWSAALESLRLEKVTGRSADTGRGSTWDFLGTLRDSSEPFSDGEVMGLGEALLFALVNPKSFSKIGRRDQAQWSIVAAEAAKALPILSKHEQVYGEPYIPEEDREEPRGPRLRHPGFICVSNIQHSPSSETRDYQLVTGTVMVDKDGRYISAGRLRDLRQPHAQASSSTDASDRGEFLEPPLTERQTVGVSFRWADRASAHKTIDALTKSSASVLGQEA